MKDLCKFEDLFKDHKEPNQEDEQLFIKDKSLFEEEKEPEENENDDKEKWKVLVVDDEKDIHKVTQMALKGFTFRDKGIKFYDAYSAKEAEQILKENPDIALILLDVVMETNNAGLDLVKIIRKKLGNHISQIIIRTGQPGIAPEREVIVSYEINDYQTKTELTSAKLFTIALASFRTFDSMQKINKMNESFKKEISAYLNRENKLLAEKEKIEKDNKIKSEFLAQMIQEIQKPLSLIINSTDQIKEEVKDKVNENIHLMFSDMECSGKRIIRAVQLIQDYSEVQSGTYKLKLENCDLLEVIEKIIADNEYLIKSNKVKMVLVNELSNTAIEADKYSLKQIFSNILDNAIKFAKEGEVLIKLFYSEDQRINIEITDSGRGIQSEHMDHIYTPFFKVQKGTDYIYNGLGLGLALVKAYIEMNKFQLEIMDASSKGTQVNITINI